MIKWKSMNEQNYDGSNNFTGTKNDTRESIINWKKATDALKYSIQKKHEAKNLEELHYWENRENYLSKKIKEKQTFTIK